MGLEDALAAHEQRVDVLLKQGGRYLAALKAWRKACELGDLGKLAGAAAQAAELAPGLAVPTAETAAAWDFDVRGYLERGEWLAEVQAAAAERHSLRTTIDDDTLISSPVVVEAVPARAALKLGRAALRSLRPRVVAAELKRLRDRNTAANSAAFLEALHGTWQRLATDARPVAEFWEVYELFCLAPGWKKDNPPTAFAQSIYALQLSGLRATRSGQTFELTRPSGKVNERRVYSVVAEDGEVIRYYGIRFR